MSLRSFGDANVRKANGKSHKISKRLREATASVTEPLEKRQLLNGIVATPTSLNTLQTLLPGFSPNPSVPEPVAAGRTFWVNGNGTGNAWQYNSSITPNTVNDLVLNVTAFSQNYTACCEAANGLGGIGCTGSINAGRLLTNGLTQNQVGNFPSTGQAAATGSGAVSDSSSPMSVLSQNGTAGWFLDYNLGNYANFSGTSFQPGSTPATNGYDITEIDVIAGHQDYRTGMQNDIQVQFQNGNTTDWFSLSNGANFSFTTDNSVGGSPQVTRGNSQMAIVNSSNPGSTPIATHVRALKFVAANQQTWYRELVVTGVPSANAATAPNAPSPIIAQLDPNIPIGRVDVVFTIPGQPSTDDQASSSYAIQRAQVTGGTVGSFTTIGGTTQNTAGSTLTFVDSSAQSGGVSYVYRVIVTDPFSSVTSANSNGILTPAATAEAHYYNEAFWTGPVFATQGVAQVGLTNTGSWFAGIGGSQDSAVFTGKLTTNGAGVYTFINNTDADGYLYVDGVLVSQDPGGHSPRDAGLFNDINGVPIGTVVPITLAASTQYDFVMLEHSTGNPAAAAMLWITPSNPGTANRQLVPLTKLSPVSDIPSIPTGLTAQTINSNFVNFTFTANNSGVVNYLLQRQDVSPNTAGNTNTATNQWMTITSIEPASNTYSRADINPGDHKGPITSISNSVVTIQDAHPLTGLSYIYRVAAVNYDGEVYSTTTQATLANVADVTAPPFLPAVLTIGSDVVSPPNAVPAIGTVADATGITTTGTYFVEYTWMNPVGGESQASLENQVVLSAAGDITAAVTLPAGISNANVFVGTKSGGERLAGTVASGVTLTVKAIPSTAARAVPTNATATLTTVADATGLAAGTYFVEYTWLNGAGGETAASLEQTVVVGTGGGDVTVKVPAAATGATNANVYISSVTGGEKLAGQVAAAGTLTVTAPLPSTTAAAPTTNTAGLPAGTYFVQYNWINLGVASPGSVENTIVLTAPLSDIKVVAPTAGGNQNANIYVSSTTGTEKLSGNVAVGSTLAVKALPSSAATAAPAGAPATLTTTPDATGLAAGTYYLRYTWTDSAFVVNAGNAGETAGSLEQSVVLTAKGDINVAIPSGAAGAAGAVNANVYVGSGPGLEKLYGAVNAGSTLAVKTLFTVAKAVPNTSTAGLAPGTYFVGYTWLGNNTTVAGETSLGRFTDNGTGTFGFFTNEKSIILTSRSDLNVSNFGTAPTGTQNVNVYVGTSSGGETLQTLVTGSNGGTPYTFSKLGMAPANTLGLNTLTQPLNVAVEPVNGGNAGLGALFVNSTVPVSTATSTIVIPNEGVAVGGLETHMYNGRLIAGAGNIGGNFPGFTGGTGGINSAFGVAGVSGGGFTDNYNAEIASGISVDGVLTGGPVEYKAQTTDQSFGSFLPGVIDRDYNAQVPAAPGAPIVQSPDGVNSPDIPRVTWEDFTQTFTGKLNVGFSGPYTIITNTDDAGFAWLNGTLVSADPGGHGQQDTSFAALTITNATNANPIVLTTSTPVPHSLNAQLVNINGVGGNTAANGNWYAKVGNDVTTNVTLYKDPGLSTGVPGNGGFNANGTLGLGSLSSNAVANNGTAGSPTDTTNGNANLTTPAGFILNSPNRGGDTLVPVILTPGQSYNLTMEMQNVGGGAGAHLKWIEPRVIDNSNINAATGLFNGSGDSATVTLNINGSAPSFSLTGYTLFITSGRGRGQNASIASWNATTQTAVVNIVSSGSNLLWTTLPDSTSGYAVALYEAIPLATADNIGPGGTAGGISNLYQDVPVQSSWNPTNSVVNGLNPGQVSTTTSGSAAGSLNITSIDPRSGVTLTWTDQSNSELWYEVQRSTDGTNFTTIGTTPFNFGTQFTDVTANNAFQSATSYFYRVRGVNFDGAGPFTPLISTNNGLIVSAPSISSIVQGLPGTAGLLFSVPGSAIDTGGLDIQYATVTSGTTGTFVDATPVTLPVTTFDYQVSGLTAAQQYVFKAKYTTSPNNSNANLFSGVVAFTPSGATNPESFGNPGTGIAGFTAGGDLNKNGNGNLPSTATPVVPTPALLGSAGGSTAPVSQPDVPVPNTALVAGTDITTVADIPAPTTAANFVTQGNNSALSGGATYFLEYTWVDSAGRETLPGPLDNGSSGIVLPNPSNSGYQISVGVPAAAPTNAVSANIYIGVTSPTTTSSGSLPANELRVGTILSAPTTAPILSFTGGGTINAGTYTFEYTFVNAAGTESPPSPATQITVGSGASIIVNTTPFSNTALFPPGATGINIYLTADNNSTTTGKLNSSASGLAPYATTPQTFTVLSANATLPLANGLLVVRAVPSGVATAPTVSSAGMPNGTYYIEYTWRNAAGGETSPSPETSFVLNSTTNSSDIIVNIPTAFPNDGGGARVTNANVYLGTVSHAEQLSFNTGTSQATTTIRGLPATNAQTPPATDLAGLPAGTYYVTYTWLSTEPNSTGGPGGESQAAPVSTVVLNSVADIAINFPSDATGAANANVYIATPIANPTNAAFALLAGTAGGSLTSTATYFLNYEWVGSGVTTASNETTVVPGPGNNSLAIVAPTLPFGAGSTRVFIGTSTGTETLAGTIGSGGTLTVATLPVSAQSNDTSNTTALNPILTTNLFAPGASGNIGGGQVGASTAATPIYLKTFPTSVNVTPLAAPTTTLGLTSVASLANPTVQATLTETFQQEVDSSLTAGNTYFVEYTWLSTAGGETAISPESSIVFGATPANPYLQVQLPSHPAGSAANANVYIGTSPGTERLAGQGVADGGSTFNQFKAVPSTAATAAPTVSTTGIAPGTYFVEYTWTRGNNSLETAASPEQSIVLSTLSNIVATAGPSPFGGGNARIYLSSASGLEVSAGNALSGLNTLAIGVLPNIDQKQVPHVASTAQRYFSPVNTLRLTDNNNNQTTAAFNLGETITPGFSTSFDFQLLGNMGADGFGFVLNNNSRTTTGGGGGGFGYTGGNYSHSVAILFNMYTPGGSGNTTALALNGAAPGGSANANNAPILGTGFASTNTWQDLTQQAGVPSGVAFSNNSAFEQRSGDIYNASITYDDTNHLLTETVTDLSLATRGIPNSFATSYSIDLVAVLGQPAAYVGFTGASGGAAAEKDILNWNWTTAGTVVRTLNKTITGTTAVDQITLKQDPDGTDIDWWMGTFNAISINYIPISDATGLTINGAGGADVITLDYTGGTGNHDPLPNKLILNQTQGSPNSFSVNGFQNTVGLANTTIDIKRSTVFFNYGAGASPLSLLQGYLASGYNGGTWTSTATTGVVTSSNAATNPNLNTDIGYADFADGTGINPNTNTVELMYTLKGDTNLDTSVNVIDLNTLIGHFGTTGDVWDQGSFTYDGSVNVLDLNQLIGNFGTVLGSQAAPAAAAATKTNSTNLGLPNAPQSGTSNSSSGSNTSDSGNSGSSSKGHSAAHAAKPSTSSGHKKHRKHRHR